MLITSMLSGDGESDGHGDGNGHDDSDSNGESVTSMLSGAGPLRTRPDIS
jgi:hypothetical protein